MRWDDKTFTHPLSFYLFSFIHSFIHSSVHSFILFYFFLYLSTSFFISLPYSQDYTNKQTNKQTPKIYQSLSLSLLNGRFTNGCDTMHERDCSSGVKLSNTTSFALRRWQRKMTPIFPQNGCCLSLTLEGETAGDKALTGEVTGVFLGDAWGEMVGGASSFPRRDGGSLLAQDDTEVSPSATGRVSGTSKKLSPSSSGYFI